MSEEEYLNVLKSLSVSESELRDRYDAVFHLSLPEKQFYTTENNKARKENYSDAEKLNNRIISVWTGHTHFRVIESNNDFNLKINRLVEEIYSFLGVSGSFEIEKKFLIEYPDISLLESLPNCKRVNITQIYLTCKKGEERRIRKREIDGSCIYFQTIKRKLSSVKRIEIENRISENEYEQLLCEADRERNPIIKRRYCLTYKGQYFEIDIYPFWNDRAIIELEMLSADEKITFPPEIRIIREVTDDPSYNNSSLSFNHNILL
jgi:CYTH domain-containing protein